MKAKTKGNDYVVVKAQSGAQATRNPVTEYYAGMDRWTTDITKARKVTKNEALDYEKEFQKTFKVGKSNIFSALDNCIKVCKENAMMFKMGAERLKKEITYAELSNEDKIKVDNQAEAEQIDEEMPF